MYIFQLKNVTFNYPGQEFSALRELDLQIRQGEFITLCGPSGCGKTTLLRQLKPSLAPHGDFQGEILFKGLPLSQMDQRTQASEIGFVSQNPDNQIVTDKVWHELAFGMESLGFKTPEIRLRVAEMASFFGIQNWFYKKVTELSGGQKQLLNLASVMTLQPTVLILDEPTAQLDPIAASEFLATLDKINRELGTTIILTEHRLEEAFPLCDRAVVLDGGRLLCQGAPKEVGLLLSKQGHSMFAAMPAPMRVFAAVYGRMECINEKECCGKMECPVTVREGRNWLDQLELTEELRLSNTTEDITLEKKKQKEEQTKRTVAVELKEVWFQYDKNGPDIIKGLSLKVSSGEITAILGGNGTGKTTALSLITGIHTPYRGSVSVTGSWAALPQNPQSIFVKNTVKEDLLEILKERKLSAKEKERRLSWITTLCCLQNCLLTHPYDLSGGEQQRAALAKVLLLEPDILLLDEPTKGFDSEFKRVFASILKTLCIRGVAVLMVSHDLEFCAEYAQRCAMFFDGNIVTEGVPDDFFSGNTFYTTAANRMARHKLPRAVTVKDVILAYGGSLPPEPGVGGCDQCDAQNDMDKKNQGKDDEPVKGNDPADMGGQQGSRGQPESTSRPESAGKAQAKSQTLRVEQAVPGERKLSGRTKAAALMILAAIPLTIFIGIYYFDDRKYYFISALVLLEALLPFILIFEKRKPEARELIVISVLCGIAVAGRAAFFWVPQFKPVIAVVMIAAVAFGGEAGFLVGAMTALVSNIFFGQGPWTPWQMFSFGTIGFLTGILFRKGLLRSNKYSLSIFGGLATFFIYGGIMNPAAVLMFQNEPVKEMFLLSYLQGIPFDLIHAAATVVFLLTAAEPLLEKLERIKLKYGLLKKS